MATYELIQKIQPSSIALIQEPWAHNGKLKGLLPNIRGFHGQLEDPKLNPRAAIIAHENVDIIPLPQFSNRDICTAIWTTKSNNPCLQKIILISWYWHSQDDLPTILEDLFRYLESNQFEYILCADTNAHSTMWGNNYTDNRGIQLEEFFFMNLIHTVNCGTRTPTFFYRCHGDLLITN